VIRGLSEEQLFGRALDWRKQHGLAEGPSDLMARWVYALMCDLRGVDKTTLEPTDSDS